ncbi:MAG: MarR family transcriptional regulator [Alphaproteobacteria bacterium]|nr:MarR family transcriptional regulator [Alphaproteobacteria bacterium]
MPYIGPSFLLSQLGAFAADGFAARLTALDLAPQHAGLLRMIVATGDHPLTQNALGQRFGVPASRLVPLLDHLESGGLVERRTNPADRRSNLLFATPAGVAMLGRIESLTHALEAELLASLTASDRAALEGLLRTLAGSLGLVPGVHPAYRALEDAP